MPRHWLLKQILQVFPLQHRGLLGDPFHWLPAASLAASGDSKLTQVQVHAQQHPEGLGHHDGRVPKVGEVNHEQWERSHCGKKELVAPAQVQNVVRKAQENHAADGEERTDELDELQARERGPG